MPARGAPSRTPRRPASQPLRPRAFDLASLPSRRPRRWCNPAESRRSWCSTLDRRGHLTSSGEGVMALTPMASPGRRRLLRSGPPFLEERGGDFADRRRSRQPRRVLAAVTVSGRLEHPLPDRPGDPPRSHPLGTRAPRCGGPGPPPIQAGTDERAAGVPASRKPLRRALMMTSASAITRSRSS